MKTKTVKMYIDLYPGWQDTKGFDVWASGVPTTPLSTGWKRVEIIVDLPCFGGSADATDVVQAKVISQ